MSDKPSLFVEFQRRNVLRAAVLYADAVWAQGQGSRVGRFDRAFAFVCR